MKAVLILGQVLSAISICRFPGLEPRIYPRLHAASHVQGANLRFKDPEVVRRNGRLAMCIARLPWM